MESLRLLFLNAELAARGALVQKLVRHRRLLKCCAAAVFLQDSRALVFLLETAERPIDRFMLLYYDSYHAVVFSF